MLGAIAGDVIGSVYEWHAVKSKSFPLFSENSRFTDDTVLTVALADSLLGGGDFVGLMKTWYRRYPLAGYGNRFIEWAASDARAAYGSLGNGAAMRISPVANSGTSLPEVLQRAQRYTAVTHNHPEGIRGGQATAAAIYLARTGKSKEEIRSYLEVHFGYELTRSVDDLREHYPFDATCEGTVAPAICSFLESDSFEDAIRNAVSLGGDSDTLASVAGSIAEAFYGGVPVAIERQVLARLDEPLREVLRRFRARYPH